ncbi:MAG: hypothetical protein AABY32_00700 [Nanoarchaeota archaeon]
MQIIKAEKINRDGKILDISVDKLIDDYVGESADWDTVNNEEDAHITAFPEEEDKDYYSKDLDDLFVRIEIVNKKEKKKKGKGVIGKYANIFNFIDMMDDD